MVGRPHHRHARADDARLAAPPAVVEHPLQQRLGVAGRGVADGVLEETEVDRFLALVERLPELGADELAGLTVTARPGLLDGAGSPKGLL